jgi:hypothetical protein
MTFKVLGVDGQMTGLVAEVSCEIAFVSESQRQEALREADAAIAKEYGGQPIPDDRREDERMYHVLHRALRDRDDVRQPFADGVNELKNALVLPEAARVWKAYLGFVDEEFPDQVDAETFEKLVEEAKTHFFADLVSSFGSDVVRRATPGLIRRLAKSPTQT